MGTGRGPLRVRLCGPGVNTISRRPARRRADMVRPRRAGRGLGSAGFAEGRLEGRRPLRRRVGVVVERVAARLDGAVDGGDEIPATDPEVGQRSDERRIDGRDGQGDRLARALEVGLDVEGHLVAVDGRDGAVKHDLEGRQVRRVVDEARRGAATGRTAIGGRIDRDGRRGAATTTEPEPAAQTDGQGQRPDEDRAAEQGERTARRSDGGIELFVSHDVLLDAAGHSGETLIGDAVGPDGIGRAQPVERVDTVRQAHSATPFHPAPFVPWASFVPCTGVDVRVASDPFRAAANRVRARCRRMATALAVMPSTTAIC